MLNIVDPTKAQYVEELKCKLQQAVEDASNTDSPSKKSCYDVR